MSVCNTLLRRHFFPEGKEGEEEREVSGKGAFKEEDQTGYWFIWLIQQEGLVLGQSFLPSSLTRKDYAYRSSL